MLKEKFIQLKSFNWQLFIALCTLALVPAIYQTVKTFIISANTPVGAFDIIGQMEWYDLINETLQAFLIIPLYSILNKIFKYSAEKFAGSVFKIGLITFVLYMLFSIGVLIYGVHLIRLMNPNDIDMISANKYLQLETVAFMIAIIGSFVNVVFVVIGKSKNVYIFMIIKVILTLITDFVFIPNFGIYGVAISNIIVNFVIALIGIILLCVQKNLRVRRFEKQDISVLKEWGKIGVFSGMQQFVDNLIYAIMVCKMVNMVAEQGNYWIANNFIWGWLLIPISALSEIVRRDCKDGYDNLKQSNYYLIVLFAVLLWGITVPAWTPFYEYAEKLSNADQIFSITIKLAPFYIAYAICAVIDNIFVGLGKTKYNTVNSIIINIGYYGVFYLLYKLHAIVMSMDVIILMFGFGMVVHLVVSLIEEKVFLKKELLKQKYSNLLFVRD